MSRNDDFDGAGRAELLVSSPGGFNLLEMSGSTFTAPVMAPNGTRFGDWNLQTGDNRFGPVGDFNGDGRAEVVLVLHLPRVWRGWSPGLVLEVGAETRASLVLSSRAFYPGAPEGNNPRESPRKSTPGAPRRTANAQ